MKPFKVYGDYGYASQQLLEEFETYLEAERWVKGYTKWGDLGGYSMIEVATFTEDGEFREHYGVYDKKEYEAA